MPKKYAREQFWELYKKLPQELKDAIFAEETSDNIYDICKRNEILKESGQIVEFVGQVLLGVLTPDEFQTRIEKELKLKKDITKKVMQEINRFIFYPVKRSLEELYSMEIISPTQTEATSPSAIEKEKGVSKRKDTYREVVE
jgi:hypothetical protein